MRLPRSVVTVILLVATHGFATDKLPRRSTSIAFVHVAVIPMDQERILQDQTVILRDGRIVAIGPAKTTRVPKGAQQIQCRGEFLIPGLTDAHVHLQSTIEFPVYLANGVTTVFNLDGRPAHLRWRQEVADGKLLGPTIFSTGPIFHQKRSPEEDVKLVDEQAAAGYDGVKIYNEVSKEEYPALIEEAKRKNLLLMGHVARGPGLEMTLQSGQSIAHLEEIVYTGFNPSHDDDFDHIVFDDSKIPAVVREIKASGVSVTATLDNFALIVQQATDLDTFLKNPELGYVAPWTLLDFQPANDRYKNRFGPEKYQVLRNILGLQRKLLKALSGAGVPLMTGTDATEVGPVAGFGLHHELEEFVHDGLTPYQALQAATTTPARYLRQSGESGSIAVGKRADVVLLECNPLYEISCTQKIAGVAVRGRWLDAKVLAAMLAQVPSEYAHEERKVKSMLQSDPVRASHYLDETDPLGKLTAFSLSEMATQQTTPELERMLKAVRQSDPNSDMVSEDSINSLGYQLLAKNLYPQALAVLAMNTQNFPRSTNTWDSLAEAFFRSGDVSNAVKNYRKALEVDATYSNANVARKFIADHPQQ